MWEALKSDDGGYDSYGNKPSSQLGTPPFPVPLQPFLSPRVFLSCSRSLSWLSQGLSTTEPSRVFVFNLTLGRSRLGDSGTGESFVLVGIGVLEVVDSGAPGDVGVVFSPEEGRRYLSSLKDKDKC